ncbi:MAG: AAA domain-containing protein [Alphaproteobacteria bacterium]|nr:AAA domain-containing protein [Alphaproteobacteria bacterium]
MEQADLIAEFDAAAACLGTARDRLSQVVFGQDETVLNVLTTLAAGGHGLLVGAPGLAKTLLVTTVGDLLSLDGKRVQFTPDLMPSDVLGSEVLEESASGARAFRFIKGPIFAQLLMADEINRASPRTQSALLQAMQEKHVTIAGERHDLPAPFHVLATQNPIEQEGTYPLPEAQLDRFLMQIEIDYPDRDAERRMLAATTGEALAAPDAAMSAEDLLRAQAVVRAMPIAERLVETILDLVRAARPTKGASERVLELVRWGPGPRASQALTIAAKARALVEGRAAPSLEDVKALAKPVLRHRMALTFAAVRQQVTVDGLIDELMAERVDRSAAA